MIHHRVGLLGTLVCAIVTAACGDASAEAARDATPTAAPDGAPEDTPPFADDSAPPDTAPSDGATTDGADAYPPPDPCAVPQVCARHATCAPSVDGPVCTCADGYEGDGHLCNPICDDANPTFSANVVDPANLLKIVPLGAVSGEIKDHTFLTMRPGLTHVAVYAPADAHLESMAYYTQDGDDLYILDWRVNCGLTYRVDHIVDPVEAIRAAGPATPASSTMGVQPNGSVDVHAGDLIGYTQGGGFDFGVFDARHRNAFIHPEHYGFVGDDGVFYPSMALTAICPYAQYGDAQRAAYEALYTSFGGEVGDCHGDCRSASRDVPDTLAGTWFDSPDALFPPSSPRLFLASDCDGSVRLVLPDGILFAGVGSPLPEDVHDQTCYSDGQRYAYFVLTSSLTVDLIEGGGPCPGPLPTGTRVTWYR